MSFFSDQDMITISQDPLVFRFLPTGDLYEIKYKDLMIGQFRGNCLDGSANNIWLRLYSEYDQLTYHSLLGVRSNCQIFADTHRISYMGAISDITYQVTFHLADDQSWVWTVDLDGSDQIVDLVYGQDIGIASQPGILTNELYTSQYIDHRIFADNGYTICSRQNMAQDGKHPFIQQGMLKGRACGYSTDGIQFFGLDYKKTHAPAGLINNLPSAKMQFENAYIAIQSEKIHLNGSSQTAFYSIFREDHPSAAEKIISTHKLIQHCQKVDLTSARPYSKKTKKQTMGLPYSSPPWSREAVNRYFPERRLAEEKNGQLLSFFTGDHAHVVMQEKEIQTERPHGTIITSRIDQEIIDSNILSSTQYMYGLFNAQLTIGNTSLHKAISTSRGLFNVMKHTGQRLYVKIDQTYRLLSMPAAFEMGMNYTRWFYPIENDTLIITCFTVFTAPGLVLQVQSEQNRPYDFIVTNQLVMGEHEFTNPVHLSQTRTDDNLFIKLKPEPDLLSPFSNWHFILKCCGAAFEMSDDRIFFTDDLPHNKTMMTLTAKSTSGFHIYMQGSLAEQLDIFEAEQLDIPENEFVFETEKKLFLEHFARMHNDIALSLSGGKKDESCEPARMSAEKEQKIHTIDKLNETIWWYTHNALIHFAVPHGLEQPGGAAWGTRDICQGPFEFFMAAQNFKMLRQILICVYANQFYDSGEWPQWFMFDGYPMKADESHGDVVIWPLKCIAEYLLATHDDHILDLNIGYGAKQPEKETFLAETLFEHICRAVSSIKQRFVNKTTLISYGGGDWDDTLQPADQTMKKDMISAWTAALCYQVINQLSKALGGYAPGYAEMLRTLADKIKGDFETYLIKDGVIAGFIRFTQNNEIVYLLHPEDQNTGIQYRLLPMSRSVIAHLASPAQALKNAAIINENLKFPDGVRLMNHPAPYQGGISKYFIRAEQAANVGREVGLQYVHAHIRYMEMLAKMGFADDAWLALMQINPVLITDQVKNAMLRQSNMYFSSSDGNFSDRYDFSKNFINLKDGTASVKGGWRLYSSGPGIYLNQLITNLLGVRVLAEGVIIDPVIPKSMSGITLSMNYLGKPQSFVFNICHSETDFISIAEVETTENANNTNPYRQTGLFISHAIMCQAPKTISVTIGQKQASGCCR